MRLLHVVNPVGEKLPQAVLVAAQRLSFQSQYIASEASFKGLQLEWMAVLDKRDANCVLPPFYTHRHFLRRYVGDMTEAILPRRLPLIGDIMQAALEVEADFYLYTNIDICLQPHFYAFLLPYLQRGYQGLIINRRRIPKYFDWPYEALSAYSSRYGRSHPGYDCFVCSRLVAERLFFSTICVGIPFIGVSFAHNLFAHARPWRLFENEDLTFHLGMEVYNALAYAYYKHNRNAFFKEVLPRLRPLLASRNLPYGHKPFWSRFFHWALNPSLFIYVNIKLEWRRICHQHAWLGGFLHRRGKVQN